MSQLGRNPKNTIVTARVTLGSFCECAELSSSPGERGDDSRWHAQHALAPALHLRSHGAGFASLALPFFRADHLTAILLFMTIVLIVARLGDDDSRGQHDHNDRADDCLIHMQFLLCPDGHYQ